jgi:hypothetical protein
VVSVLDWSLEVVKVDSKEVFTSYQDIEIKMIIHKFKPCYNEKVPILPRTYALNIYREDFIKINIQKYLHSLMKVSKQ